MVERGVDLPMREGVKTHLEDTDLASIATKSYIAMRDGITKARLTLWGKAL
jgi:hypothetical protein